ncbi:M18 family aminopeptidase [Oribacterium sp. WCC10]|uniref:M18 family aminopeptidase n=1 Tax=Oribacterium sp. WCC10 TaxID=1855343 RepID=UPI0008EF6815|nr:M18 family aminopeptidase [Oribacterium sp. WCC10]SFG38496.1 aspartyl aminopeptidase [Oribacterium sp. WCC10]
MNFDEVNKELISFLDNSPNAFFAVSNMCKTLDEAGIIRLYEGKAWELEEGKGYYVTRNDSAVIAFRIPKKNYTGFQMMASHCDSPVFKIKTNAEITIDNQYVKLNVEKYGGMLCAPWLDRPLSVAGRVVVQTEEGIETKLVNVDRDLMIIPNLAIHMNRQVNDGYAFNAQVDMLPLFCEKGEESDVFIKLIAEEAGVKPEDILDTDLFLYNRMKGTMLGLNREFVASGRLDDLQCAYASLQGFLKAEPKDSVAVHCVFDNEEVGSGTKQGAASTFLKDTLHRINSALGKTEDEYLMSIASSFLVSADNAHAVHPNHKDKSDPTNRPYLNKGIVIKYSANQKYTTDAVSGAIMRAICKKAEVPYQTFTNRSDMLGGSTLGNISQSQVALNTVDIGLPQLAMHSPFETAGARDTAYLIEAARVLFSGSMEGTGDGNYKLKF